MISAKRLPELLGGTLKDAKAFCYGVAYGYNTTIRIAPGSRNGVFGITVGAKSEADPANSGLLAYLLRLLGENKKAVKEVSVTPFTCYIAIAAPSQKKFVENANTVMKQVYTWLATYGYVTCCTFCGSTDALVSCYSVNGFPEYLCGECVAGKDAALREKKNSLATQSSSLLPGIVGALGGTLIGVIVYLLIARLGYVSALAGLVMAVLAVKGYEKFGKCLDVKGVIVCVIAVIAGAILSNRLDWSIEAASALKDYGWTFFDCFREIGFIVDELELRSDYTTSLIMALLFTVLGAVGTFISAFKGAKGNYQIVKLS